MSATLHVIKYEALMTYFYCIGTAAFCGPMANFTSPPAANTDLTMLNSSQLRSFGMKQELKVARGAQNAV